MAEVMSKRMRDFISHAERFGKSRREAERLYVEALEQRVGFLEMYGEMLEEKIAVLETSK